MEIEYDPKKNPSNQKFHDGITFHEAATAVDDPYVRTNDDKLNGERVHISVGRSNQFRLLVVVWTMRDDNLRIISSWLASKLQRKDYEKSL